MKRVLPRTFPLSRSDWHEIWNCCEENIQNKLPVDGFETTDAQQRRLSEKDWIQIYMSVEDRRDQLKLGFYGRDTTAREWRQQMDGILGVLDEVRQKFIGAN